MALLSYAHVIPTWSKFRTPCTNSSNAPAKHDDDTISVESYLIESDSSSVITSAKPIDLKPPGVLYDQDSLRKRAKQCGLCLVISGFFVLGLIFLIVRWSRKPMISELQELGEYGGESPVASPFASPTAIFNTPVPSIRTGTSPISPAGSFGSPSPSLIMDTTGSSARSSSRSRSPSPSLTFKPSFSLSSPLASPPTTNQVQTPSLWPTKGSQTQVPDSLFLPSGSQSQKPSTSDPSSASRAPSPYPSWNPAFGHQLPDKYRTFSNPPSMGPAQHGRGDPLGVDVSSSASPFPSKTPSVSLTCPARLPVPPLPGKKGIGFTMRAEGKSGSWVENMPRLLKLKPHWNYSWGPGRPESQPDDIEFVPMIYGAVNKMEDNIQNLIADKVNSGIVKRVLGYNEPDSPTQSDLPVQVALDHWPLLEALGVPLVSPSAQKSLGEWMKTFTAVSDKNCYRMDWIGVHWYGGPNVSQFRKRMREIYEAYGNRPLLITEFGPVDWDAEVTGATKFTESDVLDFMKQALPWLEKQDWIAGYAWFPFIGTSRPQGSASALFNDDNSLTTLGQYYASVRAENPDGDLSIGTI